MKLSVSIIRNRHAGTGHSLMLEMVDASGEVHKSFEPNCKNAIEALKLARDTLNFWEMRAALSDGNSFHIDLD